MFLLHAVSSPCFVRVKIQDAIRLSSPYYFSKVLGFSNQKPAIPSVGCVDVFWKKFIEAIDVSHFADAVRID